MKEMFLRADEAHRQGGKRMAIQGYVRG